MASLLDVQQRRAVQPGLYQLQIQRGAPWNRQLAGGAGGAGKAIANYDGYQQCAYTFSSAVTGVTRRAAMMAAKPRPIELDGDKRFSKH